MDNVTVVFLNGTSEMSNSVIISEVSDLMLVSIHDIAKETDCMGHLHLWILTLISNHLAVTVTTFNNVVQWKTIHGVMELSTLCS